MLYAISGGQGSGKSTVLRELQQKGYDVIERKTSRSILKDWGVSLSEVNNDRLLTLNFQEEILKRKIEDEEEAVSSDNIVFTERTYMDLFVYATAAIGKDNEHSNWLDQYYDRCFSAQQESYKKVFYLTSGHFKPVDDGVRAVNQHYQKMIDLTLADYISQFIRVTTVDVMQIGERVELIEKVLKEDLE